MIAEEYCFALSLHLYKCILPSKSVAEKVGNCAENMVSILDVVGMTILSYVALY